MKSENLIRQFRQLNRITAEKLSTEIGWGPTRLRNYESGLRTPGLDECRCIIHALNRLGVACTLDQVFPPTTFVKNPTADDGKSAA